MKKWRQRYGEMSTRRGMGGCEDVRNERKQWTGVDWVGKQGSGGGEWKGTEFRCEYAGAENSQLRGWSQERIEEYDCRMKVKKQRCDETDVMGEEKKLMITELVE